MLKKHGDVSEGQGGPIIDATGVPMVMLLTIAFVCPQTLTKLAHRFTVPCATFERVIVVAVGLLIVAMFELEIVQPVKVKPGSTPEMVYDEEVQNVATPTMVAAVLMGDRDTVHVVVPSNPKNPNTGCTMIFPGVPPGLGFRSI